jgi:hypothetical protein
MTWFSSEIKANFSSFDESVDWLIDQLIHDKLLCTHHFRMKVGKFGILKFDSTKLVMFSGSTSHSTSVVGSKSSSESGGDWMAYPRSSTAATGQTGIGGMASSSSPTAGWIIGGANATTG